MQSPEELAGRRPDASGPQRHSLGHCHLPQPLVRPLPQPGVLKGITINNSCYGLPGAPEESPSAVQHPALVLITAGALTTLKGDGLCCVGLCNGRVSLRRAIFWIESKFEEGEQICAWLWAQVHDGLLLQGV